MLNFVNLFSQSNKTYKHIISIDPISCLDRTISISYAFKFADKCELTINPKIQFQSKRNNVIIFGLILDDPYWLYNSYSLRLGIRRNLYKKLYMKPIIYYKYAFFENRIIKIEDHEGDGYDKYNKLNREYNSGGLILKFGLKFDRKRLRINIFNGIGYNIRKYNEQILEQIQWHSSIPSYHPTESNYWKNNLSFHLGLEIGFRI
jgi:hypothetical protein